MADAVIVSGTSTGRPPTLPLLRKVVGAVPETPVYLGSGVTASSVTRFLIGVGCAFSLVGAMAVAGQWFPRERFALLAGLAMMFGMLGGVFGQAPLRMAVDASGWRMTMASVGIVGFGLMLAALYATWW